jgi:hypothetical protein
VLTAFAITLAHILNDSNALFMSLKHTSVDYNSKNVKLYESTKLKKKDKLKIPCILDILTVRSVSHISPFPNSPLRWLGVPQKLNIWFSYGLLKDTARSSEYIFPNSTVISE